MVADGIGHIYDNIEDTSEVIEIDAKGNTRHAVSLTTIGAKAKPGGMRGGHPVLFSKI